MQKCFILLDRHAPRQCRLELLQPEGLRRQALPTGVAAATAAVAGGSGGTGAVRGTTGSPWLRGRGRESVRSSVSERERERERERAREREREAMWRYSSGPFFRTAPMGSIFAGRGWPEETNSDAP